jgi:uncharacterized protein YwqG
MTAPEQTLNAICFKAEFPPKHDEGAVSYFGGRPCLPPDVGWPEITRRGSTYALTFLGQIDLEEIASVGEFRELPSTGVLYFFLDTNIINEAGLIDESLDSGTPWRVIYSEAGAHVRKLTAAPPNLMPCFGYPYAQAPFEMKWTHHIDWRTRYYSYEAPRIRMAPLPVKTVFTFSEQDEQRQIALWIDAFGEPVPHESFPERTNALRRELWLPLPAFPTNNLFLEIFTGGLLTAIVDRWGDKQLQSVGGDLVPAIREMLGQIQPGNLFSTTAPGQRERLSSIMHDLARRNPSVIPTLNGLLRQAYFWGATLSLSYSRETAKSIPGALAEMTRSLFCPLYCDADQPNRIDCRVHQMLGYGKELQRQVEDHLGSHIMLMQFASDPAFGWMYGDCGVAQFWITPEDLAAKRFDNVTATVEGQ